MTASVPSMDIHSTDFSDSQDAPHTLRRVEIQARVAETTRVQSLGVYIGWAPPLPAAGDWVEGPDGDERRVIRRSYAYASDTAIVTLWLE